jgi:peptidoglycan hydrolase-like amidase
MRRPLLLAVAVLLSWLVPCPPTGAQVPPPTEVVVHGHGFGHGRGLGQFGAYGYAKDEGWTWEQITAHFYGGTSLGTTDDTELDVLLKGYGTGWTIAMLESGTIVTSLDAQLPVPPSPARRAVAVQWLGGDSWTLYEGDSCTGMAGGPFVAVGTFTAAEVVVSTTTPAPASRTGLLAVCERTGHRYLRGAVVADGFAMASDPTARQRTLSRVRVESYLRSVVPSESPSSWGGNGTAPGMHALRAQAVAARSYALAPDTRWGLADTCDDIFCQVYRGFGTNTGGTVTLFESVNGDLAVAQTAGQVRRSGAAVARTEFSSSTGGYSAGGAFPAVVDDGDDVTANPNHNWTARIPVTTLEQLFDARAGRDLGTFQRLLVLDRNGLGRDGGRVRSVRAELTAGTVTVTGEQFRSMFQANGVKSDWFVVPDVVPARVPPAFSDVATNVHAGNVAKVASAGIAGGFPDGSFRPDQHVTRGQMASFLVNGYRLAAAAQPTFTDTVGDVHEANIRAVAAAGIAQGHPGGTYQPGALVTRGQMAVFLARGEGLSPIDGAGPAAGGCDVDGHLYEGHMRAVLAAGVATGGADGCFRPDAPVTRGQMASFLVRALGL